MRRQRIVALKIDTARTVGKLAHDASKSLDWEQVPA